MLFKHYLTSENLTYKQFAEMIPCSPSAVAKYALGLREPKKKIRRRIIELCKGKVKAEDLMLK